MNYRRTPGGYSDKSRLKSDVYIRLRYQISHRTIGFLEAMSRARLRLQRSRMHRMERDVQIASEEQRKALRSNRLHLYALLLAFIVFGIVPFILVILDHAQK